MMNLSVKRPEDLSHAPISAYQHALLGEISFDLSTSFETIEYKWGADYVEHAVLEGKPRLQAIGEQLSEIIWHLVFHQGFCNPERELLKLKQAIAAQMALPLVFSNGDYQGWFIPLEITVNTKQTSKQGTAILIEAQLKLREYNEPKMLINSLPKKNPEAVETHHRIGIHKPVRTVKKTPTARSINAGVCRNGI